MLTNEHEPFRLSPEIADHCGPLMPVLEALLQSIYGRREEGNDRISGKDVLSEVQAALKRHGDWINFYPSDQKGPCSDRLMVLALNGWPAADFTHGKLNCAQALEILVQHVQGHCYGVTRWAVIVTALWDHYAYDRWRSNIDTMRNQGVRIAFLQLGPAGPSLIMA
jgi:hypothetical protein